MQRQYFCPHCDQTFGAGADLQSHVIEDHPRGDDHRLPAGMGHLSATAAESGWHGDECDALWI